MKWVVYYVVFLGLNALNDDAPLGIHSGFKN
jgi:hypothetical protein